MTKTWMAECLECEKQMVGETREVVERALEQHIRVTSHQAWSIRSFRQGNACPGSVGLKEDTSKD